jgi:hypothetical protein
MSVCVAGTCSTAYNRTYTVTMVSAKINQLDYSSVPAGEAWDVPGGMPDPLVVITVGSASWQTSAKQDTLTPTWNEGFDVMIKQGELFRLDVWDDDLTTPDWIGGFEWKQGLDMVLLKAGGAKLTPSPPDPKYGVQELVVGVEAR